MELENLLTGSKSIINMIDFHNHVLPDLDDGSKSLEMSINMIREAVSQGIKEVVNTVHYQHPQMEHKDLSHSRICEKFSLLQSEIEAQGLSVRLHLGTEVYFSNNLTKIIDNPLVTIGNGKYMLIEFPVIQFPPSFDEILFKLKIEGITPIIAHPERYRQIQYDILILSKLVQSGCLVQIDAGSIMGNFGFEAKKTAVKILQYSLCHIIGSDSHNDKNRNFCLGKVVEICNNELKINVSKMVNENPKKILKGELIDSEINLDQSFIKDISIWEKFKIFFGGN